MSAGLPSMRPSESKRSFPAPSHFQGAVRLRLDSCGFPPHRVPTWQGIVSCQLFIARGLDCLSCFSQSLPSLSQSHRSLAHTAFVTALPILASSCSFGQTRQHCSEECATPRSNHLLVSSSMPATNAKTGTCRGSRSQLSKVSTPRRHETEMSTQATFTKITSSCSWKLSKA